MWIVPRVKMETRKKRAELEKRFEAALESVDQDHRSLRAAEDQFGIPKSTLHDHATGKFVRIGAGRPPILSEEEEKAIVRSCQELARCGFGLDRMIVGCVVKTHLEKEKRDNPFKDGIPGKKWWKGFLQRWPCLSERKPQHFPTSRALSSTPDVMNKFYENVQVH